MKVLKNKRTNYTVSLEISTEYEDIEKATEPAFKELVKDAKVPGFRQGKVPRPIFEQYYGKEMLISRASSLVMNDCYRQVIEQEKLEVVDIPTGYTHNIENTGTTDMVTVMWANEIFDPNNPDTFYEEV